MSIDMEIVAIRNKIDTVIQARAKLEGQLETTMASLRSEFDVDTLEKGEEELARMVKEYQERSAVLEDEIAQLKSELGM